MGRPINPNRKHHKHPIMDYVQSLDGKPEPTKPTQPTNTDIATQSSSVKKSGHQNWGCERVKPGDNSRYLRYAMASLSLPPIDISDESQVQQRIIDYLNFCGENDRKPNMVGLANWLGVDHTTLDSWKRGEYRATTHSPIIKKTLAMLEEQWVDYMQNGKINPASGIFLAKNMFGYRNVQDMVVTPNNPVDTRSASEVRQQYLEGLPESKDDPS